MKKIHRVYVYGTLKRGQYFHNQYLGGEKSIFISPAKASLEYSLYVDGLPHLIRQATDEHVKGELFLVDEKVLATLDELEGHPVVYRRELIEVFDESGARMLAWAYLRHPSFKGKKHAFKETEFV